MKWNGILKYVTRIYILKCLIFRCFLRIVNSLLKLSMTVWLYFDHYSVLPVFLHTVVYMCSEMLRKVIIILLIIPLADCVCVLGWGWSGKLTALSMTPLVDWVTTQKKRLCLCVCVGGWGGGGLLVFTQFVKYSRHFKMIFTCLQSQSPRFESCYLAKGGIWLLNVQRFIAQSLSLSITPPSSQYDITISAQHTKTISVQTV